MLHFFVLAFPARVERAAFRLGGERSILLSYGNIFKKFPLARVLFRHLFILSNYHPIVNLSQ